MNRDRGDPIYIDSSAMLENRVGLEARGMAMDLISLLWWPTRQPFEWDIPKLSTFLSKELPARGYSEETLRRNETEVKTFFTVLPDGRWAPNPKFFSMTNGNPGAAS